MPVDTGAYARQPSGDLRMVHVLGLLHRSSPKGDTGTHAAQGAPGIESLLLAGADGCTTTGRASGVWAKE